MKTMKKKTPTYNMTWEQIENVKQEATKKATRKAFNLMIILPVMVLRDKWGFGNKRLWDFVLATKDLYDSYEKDYLTLDDMVQAIEEETGIKISL